MAEAKQVLRQHAGGGAVVDADEVASEAGHLVVDGDDRRQVVRLELPDVVGAPADRRQDDAGDVLGAELREHGELALNVVVGIADDDRIAGGDRRVLHRPHHR